MVLHKLIIFPLILSGASLYGMRYDDSSFLEQRARDRQWNQWTAQWRHYSDVVQNARRNEEECAAREVLSMMATVRFNVENEKDKPMGAGAGAGASQSCNGITINDLPVEHQREVQELDRDIKRALDKYDTRELERMRAEITEKLAMTNLSQDKREMFRRQLELLDSHTKSPSTVAYRDMRDGDDAKKAEDSYKYLRDKFKRHEISKQQFEKVEAAFENRPERKAFRERMVSCCDWVRTEVGHGHEVMNIQQRLRANQITLDPLEFDPLRKSLNPAETQRYLTAHMSVIGMAREMDPLIEWNDWGVATVESISQIFKPVIAGVGVAHGAGNAIAKPMIDTGAMICNIFVEVVKKQFLYDIDTPAQDALKKWIKDSGELYQKDPYQAGMNLGSTLVKIALPLAKKNHFVTKTQMQLYKRTLSTCKTTNDMPLCIVM